MFKLRKSNKKLKKPKKNEKTINCLVFSVGLNHGLNQANHGLVKAILVPNWTHGKGLGILAGMVRDIGVGNVGVHATEVSLGWQICALFVIRNFINVNTCQTRSINLWKIYIFYSEQNIPIFLKIHFTHPFIIRKV